MLAICRVAEPYFRLHPTDARWTEQVLFSFNGGDGATPDSGVVLDRTRSLYGTAAFGGASGHGVVFELIPGQDDTWQETVLHDFRANRDGSTPFGTPLFGRAGNLYGTTRYGPGKRGARYGTVFELVRRKNSWAEMKLYEFAGGADGADPYTGLTSDGNGNFYGTTFNGGHRNRKCLGGSCGTVFMLFRNVHGNWTKRTLHRFCSTRPCADNGNPKANVILDKHGNLYGGTSHNPGGYGTVYELSPKSDGSWRETILHAFHGIDGDDVDGGLLLDQAGNLYGVTDVGGPFQACTDGEKIIYHPLGCGTVFELSPNFNGGWRETVLHDFGLAGDGSHPRRSLIMDGDGNFFGVTTLGGLYGQGMVFEITP